MLAVAGVLASSAALAEGYPTDDPTLKPYQLTVAQYANRCSREMSNAERSNCLHEQFEVLKKRIDQEYRKAIIDAEDIGDSKEIGGVPAAQIAKLNRAEVTRTQSAWKAYLDARCGTMAKSAERNGANGAGPAVEMAQCYIRLAVARLNELTR